MNVMNDVMLDVKIQKISPIGFTNCLKAKTNHIGKKHITSKTISLASVASPLEILLSSQRRMASAGVVCGGLRCGPSAAVPAVHLTFTQGVTSTCVTWEMAHASTQIFYNTFSKCPCQ